MDKALRSLLYTAVVKCRALLEEELGLQLEGAYGVHGDGRVEPLAGLTHLDAVGRADRQAVEAALRHFEMAGGNRQQAVERFVRESAYTVLNRLAALKLMEHPSRALIQLSVGAGDRSKGFTQLALVSPEAMRSQPDGGYQRYLELLFDDLARIPVLAGLFDRSLPTSLLFPTQPCLHEVLSLLNDPQLEAAWGEDETIGWSYQYFTPAELRDQARKASSAPRNSYELAFRNQFYTPRYVARFLVDNTLGRLWWQMMVGQTRLAQVCTYLIRPDRATNGAQPDDPAFTSAKRDPRTIRILDPAVGSAHFLLYCFELLLIIYEEAWADPDLGPALQADYPDWDAYRRAVPGMILRYNLHGIDIDPRAVQIASLALWLRAQRAFQDQSLKRRQRPLIDTIHIVCAEPMPGEYDLLGEFARDLRPAILDKLLREIWDKMRLAGEAGSLLKIEQEIRQAITHARVTLQNLPAGVQLSLFTPEQPQATQPSTADLDDGEFWDQAVERVIDSLRAYAQRARDASDGRNVLRRLFAGDALQGMALIDLLQEPFDVVLMNPPFGAASLGSKEYIAKAYPRTKNDLYAAFVERGLELLRPGGYLGAITSRTGFFLTSFQKWREEILLQEAQLIALADLGYGVLDTAMVETAAYVLRNHLACPAIGN